MFPLTLVLLLFIRLRCPPGLSVRSILTIENFTVCEWQKKNKRNSWNSCGVLVFACSDIFEFQCYVENLISCSKMTLDLWTLDQNLFKFYQWLGIRAWKAREKATLSLSWPVKKKVEIRRFFQESEYFTTNKFVPQINFINILIALATYFRVLTTRFWKHKVVLILCVEMWKNK